MPSAIILNPAFTVNNKSKLNILLEIRNCRTVNIYPNTKYKISDIDPTQILILKLFCLISSKNSFIKNETDETDNNILYGPVFLLNDWPVNFNKKSNYGISNWSCIECKNNETVISLRVRYRAILLNNVKIPIGYDIEETVNIYNNTDLKIYWKSETDKIIITEPFYNNNYSSIICWKYFQNNIISPIICYFGIEYNNNIYYNNILQKCDINMITWIIIHIINNQYIMFGIKIDSNLETDIITDKTNVTDVTDVTDNSNLITVTFIPPIIISNNSSIDSITPIIGCTDINENKTDVQLDKKYLKNIKSKSEISICLLSETVIAHHWFTLKKIYKTVKNSPHKCQLPEEMKISSLNEERYFFLFLEQTNETLDKYETTDSCRKLSSIGKIFLNPEKKETSVWLATGRISNFLLPIRYRSDDICCKNIDIFCGFHRYLYTFYIYINDTYLSPIYIMNNLNIYNIIPYLPIKRNVSLENGFIKPKYVTVTDNIWKNETFFIPPKCSSKLACPIIQQSLVFQNNQSEYNENNKTNDKALCRLDIEKDSKIDYFIINLLIDSDTNIKLFNETVNLAVSVRYRCGYCKIIVGQENILLPSPQGSAHTWSPEGFKTFNLRTYFTGLKIVVDDGSFDSYLTFDCSVETKISIKYKEQMQKS
eukprot:GHVL01007871.1.p1 GENE.GHVL01007871.1~~GHVL01007871.1.p1  ORF type:complete len:732 (-),score=268.82 GHVL01007871.1:1684-3642(-)